MTGLNSDTDIILSISCFLTDAQLNFLEPHGYEATIKTPKTKLDEMDQWCTETHSASGLITACLSSRTTASTAANSLLAYIKTYVPQERKALLAGNSVHADAAFLKKEPWDIVIKHLHYRILDVSSIKEAVRRWGSVEVLTKVPKKQTLHTAREDILESIEEAKYYKKVLFGDMGKD
jgi:oligoribonuclease